MTQHELQIEPYDGKHREDVRATAYLQDHALIDRATVRVYVAGVRVNTPPGMRVEVAEAPRRGPSRYSVRARIPGDDAPLLRYLAELHDALKAGHEVSLRHEVAGNAARYSVLWIDAQDAKLGAEIVSGTPSVFSYRGWSR